MTPSREDMVRGVMRDLIIDIRTAEVRDKDRPGSLEYAQKVRRELATLFKARHTTRLDPYGWPLVLKEAAPEGDAARRARP